MMRCDLSNMLRQVLDVLDEAKRRKIGCGPQIAGIEQLKAHVEQVRTGEATLDEFADLYMLRRKDAK